MARIPRPDFLNAMGAVFVETFGGDAVMRLEGGDAVPAFAPRDITVIIRELREANLAEDAFAAVEGATHLCSAPIDDCADIVEGMTLTLQPGGPTFIVRGRPDDGRAMTRLFLEEVPL